MPSPSFLLIENHSEIENMLSLDYTRGRAVLTSEDIGALGFEETEAKLRALMAKHLTLDNVTFELTGTPVVAYRGINRVTEEPSRQSPIRILRGRYRHRYRFFGVFGLHSSHWYPMVYRSWSAMAPWAYSIIAWTPLRRSSSQSGLASRSTTPFTS